MNFGRLLTGTFGCWISAVSCTDIIKFGLQLWSHDTQSVTITLELWFGIFACSVISLEGISSEREFFYLSHEFIDFFLSGNVLIDCFGSLLTFGTVVRVVCGRRTIFWIKDVFGCVVWFGVTFIEDVLILFFYFWDLVRSRVMLIVVDWSEGTWSERDWFIGGRIGSSVLIGVWFWWCLHR